MRQRLSPVIVTLMVLASAAAQGQPSASPGYRLTKLGDRWTFVTPAGKALFVRAVSKVDTADWGGAGGFQSYDAVYLQSADGRTSPNLAGAAADNARADVVRPGTRDTLRAKGDALLIGCGRFRPEYTYLWLDRLGVGGRVRWLYSTKAGWKPVNGTGVPWKAASPSPVAGYHFDCGNFVAPDANGFGEQGNKQANKLAWWDMATGFPPDFAPIPLPTDPAPRYYLKAETVEPFTTAPVLNQVYDRPQLEEAVARKYGPGDYALKWADAMTARLRAWGFNAAGMYSYRYSVEGPKLADRLPYEPTWQLSGWTMDRRRTYRVKSVYAGAVFPPGSKSRIWQGLQADVFEPTYETAIRELVREQPVPSDPWIWALVPEEGDHLFGIDKRAHDHMGYVVLSQNPYRASDPATGDAYKDPRFYAKYALRDFLRSRYMSSDDTWPRLTVSSKTPAYAYAGKPGGLELAELTKLNSAWGTHYTTWDTSMGSLADGTNAYGTGTGFMDEDGRHILAPGAKGTPGDKEFSDLTHPAIRKDLDDFVAIFAARYGRILADAFKLVQHPPLVMPLYDAPDTVYAALGPYVDAFWVNADGPQDALRVYNRSRKPVIVSDYLVADMDSQLYFRATIRDIRFEAPSGRTVLTLPDLRYPYRMARFVNFVEADELNKTGMNGTKYVYPHPRIASIHGTTMEVPGDFTGAVKPGMHVESWKESGYPYRTQAARAQAMVDRDRAFVGLRGDDGVRFVVGFEHWCLYDPSVSNWGDNENFGLVTLQDNAYDGVEARRAAAKDARGYPIGGEESDYGDVLGPLSRFLRSLDAATGGSR